MKFLWHLEVGTRRGQHPVRKGMGRTEFRTLRDETDMVYAESNDQPGIRPSPTCSENDCVREINGECRWISRLLEIANTTSTPECNREREMDNAS